MIRFLGMGGPPWSRRELAERLEWTGLGEPAARQMAGRFLQLAEALAALGGNQRGATRAFFVPGRIEVLGKHTDYAGGSSLVSAVERGFCLMARPRQDQQVRVVDAPAVKTAIRSPRWTGGIDRSLARKSAPSQIGPTMSTLRARREVSRCSGTISW